MKNKLVLIGIVVIVLLLFGAGMGFMMQSFTRQALAPINDTAQAMKTQVAQVLHPTPTILPDPVTIIDDVRSLARLETIQYSVEKIITAETGREVFGPLFGDQLLFVAHGIVIGGVDLNKMEASNMEVRNGVLTVHLPDAEIFIATLDNTKSYVYDRQTGLLTKGEKDLETLARQAAEEEIHSAALDDGILELAAANAEIYLTRLFHSLGFDNVVFE